MLKLRFRSSLMTACLAAAAVFATALLSPSLPSAIAQEKSDAASEPLPPIITFNVAGVDRLMSDVKYVFDAAGKPQMFDVVKGLLGNIGDLKGIDRGKPFGVMLYLASTLPPQPSGVVYVPIKNVDEALKLLELGPFSTRKLKDKPGRYEITGPGNFTGQLLIKNGYAFGTDRAENFDRGVPDPLKVAGPLARRYDIAVSVTPKAIPTGTRKLLAGLLKTASEAQLQQRDNENDESYQMRRDRGLRDVELLTGLLTECEQVVVGLDASKDRKNVVLEFEIEATPDTDFAKSMKRTLGGKSYFASLGRSDAPLSFVMPLDYSDTDRHSKANRKLLMTSINSLESGLARLLDGSDPKADTKQAARFANLVEPLKAAARKGKVDFFGQIVGNPPEKFSVLAGLRITDGRRLAVGLSEVLTRLKARENAPEITLNAASHQGVNLHRISVKQTPGPIRQFFGDQIDIHIGSSSTVVWLSAGGQGSLPALKAAIDKLADSKGAAGKGSGSPMQFSLNLASWLALTGGDNQQPGGFRDLAREAFSKGSDSIRAEVRPMENGARVRVEFGEGFLRLIGLGINRQYERSQGN